MSTPTVHFDIYVSYLVGQCPAVDMYFLNCRNLMDFRPIPANEATQESGKQESLYRQLMGLLRIQWKHRVSLTFFEYDCIVLKGLLGASVCL